MAHLRNNSIKQFPRQLVLTAFISLGCAGTSPAPCEHPSDETAHHHAHDEALASTSSTPPAPSETPETHGAVISHETLRSFENNGNVLVGIATKGMGAKSFEVWRTSVAPGSATPPHRHGTEEVFVFLKGKGKAIIGGATFEFTAPATVIAPAGVDHQFINTGDTPTDAIVVVGIDSMIYDQSGKEMNLPWRK